MKRISSGFAPILVVVILGIIGVFAYLMLNPKTSSLNLSPTPTASPAPNGNLASWKTYTNEAYDYQVKYPSDWEVTYIYASPTPEAVRFLKRPSGQGIDIHEKVVNILVEPNPKKYSPTIKWYKEIWAPQIPAGINFESLRFEETSFTGLPALRVSNKIGYNTLFFAKDSQMYRVEWYIVDYGNADSQLIESTEQIFNQILSTFQFTN